MKWTTFSPFVFGALLALASIGCATETIIPVGPPALREETPGTPPSDQHFWVRGYWQWNEPQQQHVWVPGHWEAKRADAVWAPGHWRQTSGGWVWTDGRWVSR